MATARRRRQRLLRIGPLKVFFSSIEIHLFDR
jgi:hypothetical protein